MTSEAAAPAEHEGKVLRRALLRAFQNGAAPDFDSGPIVGWLEVINKLLERGKIEPARHALHHLRAQKPELELPQSLLSLVDMLPDEAAWAPSFEDDRQKDVQVVACPGAKSVVFAFCGRRHQLNMALVLFQRWMGPLGASTVYLRDFNGSHYVAGVKSLGSRPDSIAALRRIAADLGAERIFCLGNSSGGYAAMRYGLDLGAERVMNFGGSTNLEPGFNAYLNRVSAASQLRERFPDEPLDLRELYLAAPAPPRAILVHGAEAWDDRLQQEHMAGVAGAIMLPVLGYGGHGVLPEMIRRSRFSQLLDAFVAPGDEALEILPDLGAAP